MQPNKPNIKLFTLENRNIAVRRVSTYQRDNQNPYIEHEQTTQWRKEKVQKDKQRSTKHTHKITSRALTLYWLHALSTFCDPTSRALTLYWLHALSIFCDPTLGL